MSSSDWIDAVIGENFAATVIGDAVAGGELAAFLCDDTLAFVAVNDAACALTGYSSEELLRLCVPDVVAAPDERLLHAARNVGEGSSWNGTWRLRRKDGRTVDVTFVSEAVHIDGADGFVFTLCWPPNTRRSQRARRWATELHEEARALREQAALQIERARARRRSRDGESVGRRRFPLGRPPRQKRSAQRSRGEMADTERQVFAADTT